MPIPVPTLDDRTFHDLVEEARSLIPDLQPNWTDHNPTDTGIILIEMLAWLTEMICYRLDQIPEDNYRAFLRLLGGDLKDVDLEDAIRETISALRKPCRAVTCRDFEDLVTDIWPGDPEAKNHAQVSRVHCLPRRNLEATDGRDQQAHVSLVVVPEPEPGTIDRAPKPDEGLLGALWYFLDERRLLTTRHHVVGPHYKRIKIKARLYLLEKNIEAEDEAHYAEKAAKRLGTFFDPLKGGAEGRGWPLGQAVYPSRVYQRLTEIPWVDYVDAVELFVAGSEGKLSSIPLQDDELVCIESLLININGQKGKDFFIYFVFVQNEKGQWETQTTHKEPAK